MLARLFVAVPFNMAVPDAQPFKLYSYEDAGYQVTVYPPARTDLPLVGDAPTIKMNGSAAFLANGLQIDFKRDSFNRSKHSEWDPPESVLRRAVDLFVSHLRFRTRGAQIRPLPWPHVVWRLRYLNDDGSELSEDPALIRACGTRGFNWSWVGLDARIWDEMHQLSPDYVPPVWDELRLDAHAALPHVGTAVVLGATCFEVFVATVLDQLAAEDTVPTALWSWINDRGDWLREPTTDEQFDKLLHYFTKHSLKENCSLWEGFKNLKSARNSFVHEGVAKLGGTPLAPTDTARLLGRVSEIIDCVRQWLPADLQWPVFEQHVSFTIEQELTRPNTPLQPPALPED